MPVKKTKPAPKKRRTDQYFLNPEKLDKLKTQILLILADYQNCGVTTCPKCCKPFIKDDEGRGKCPECGADQFGFTRAEGIRIEVAERILANLKIIGAPEK